MLEISLGCEFDITAFDELFERGIRVSFFGAPPAFRLDGGRIIHECKDEFGQVISYLMRRSIPFNLCCNTVLEPNELEIDDQTWKTLEQVYSPNNGVIVSRHWLAERIRSRYPDFRFLFSSIGVLTESWDENVLFSNYDVVVCPVERTNDFSVLSNADNWRKLEVFLNNECIGFGVNCIDHYRYNSEVNNGMIAEAGFTCPNMKRGRTSPRRLQVTVTDVSTYLRLGVRRFKCIERTARGQRFGKYLDLVLEASNSRFCAGPITPTLDKNEASDRSSSR